MDTWTYFHDQILAVLDLADRIILLMNSELTTIKNVRLFLEVAEALGLRRRRRCCWWSTSGAARRHQHQDIQRSINHPVAATVVSDPQTVVSAVNRGVPFVLGHTRQPDRAQRA